MPIYEYECSHCDALKEESHSIAARHTDAPFCTEFYECMLQPMKLIISAVGGVVKFPAAGGHEYVSTTTGRVISTERARRDDLKRSHCRPYEGFEAEKKESLRKAAYEEKKSDAKLEDATRHAYHQLSPTQRRALDAA